MARIGDLYYAYQKSYAKGMREIWGFNAQALLPCVAISSFEAQFGGIWSQSLFQKANEQQSIGMACICMFDGNEEECQLKESLDAGRIYLPYLPASDERILV